MADAPKAWRAHEHGPIRKLAENLWWVDGSLPKMPLRRVMTVVRMQDGGLVVHSAIALNEAAMTELEAWGTPRFLIVPNAFHRLDAPAYKERYPQIRVFAPSGSRAKVAEVIRVDSALEVFPGDPSVEVAPLAGIRDAEMAMIVRSKDGTTVVLNDAVFNMDKKKDLLGNLITTAFGSAPGPRVSRLFKLLAVKDAKALRADLERLAALPGLTRLIVAHEKVASGPDAAAALRAAATFLK